MSNGMEKTKLAGRNRLWNRLLWSVVLLILFVALLLASSPFFLEKSLKSWTEDSGYGKTSIGQLQFNPLLGTLVLKDVEIRQRDQVAISLSEARIWLDWFPLWQKRVVVRDFTLKGLKSRLHQDDNGVLMLGSIPLASEQDEPSEPSGWGVGLDSARLLGSELNIDLDNLKQTLKIESLQLSELTSWLVNEPAMLDFNGNFAGAGIKLGGELLPFSDNPGGDLSLKLSGLDVAIISSALKLDAVAFSGTFSSTSKIKAAMSNGGFKLNQKGNLDLNDAVLNFQDQKIGHKSLSWKGDIEFSNSAQGEPNATAHGGLTLQGVNASVDEVTGLNLESLSLPGLRFAMRGSAIKAGHKGSVQLAGIDARFPEGGFEDSSIEWDGEISAESKGDALTLALDGKLLASDPRLSLKQDDTGLSLSELQWSGQLALNQAKSATEGEPATLSVNSESELALAQAGVTSKAGEVLGEIKALMWKGSVNISDDSQEIRGELSTGEGHMDAPGAGIRIAGWNSLQAGPIMITGALDTRVEVIELDAFSIAEAMKDGVPEKESAMISFGSSRIGQVEFSQSRGLSIGELIPTDLTVRVHRDTEGQWNPARLADQLTALSGDDQQEESAGEPMRIAMPGIELQGENRVFLIDEKVKPVYKGEFLIKTLTVGAMDSAKPDQPVAFEGDILIGKHSKLDLGGKAFPFARQRSGNFALDASALEIPPLSAYSEGMLGYSLDSGQMDSKIELAVDKGKLDGLVKLQLYKMEVSPLDSEARAKLETQMSVPLGTALDLLRDDDNTIKLDLPIAGDLDNPDFDISDAINQATGKALKKGAMTYLMAALQPFGALVAIASAAGDAASAVRLDPILFNTGNNQWREKTEEYLAKVGGVMKERPDLRIRVCGFSTAMDRAAIITTKTEKLKQEQAAEGEKTEEEGEAGDEQPANPAVTVTDEELLALAGERADKVKGYLVKQHAVDAGRLISCKPAVDKEQKAEPRVDLLI